MTTCVQCGQPAPSPVCSSCTARISQGALEGIIKLIEERLRFTGTMHSICCVCKVEYGTKPCLPELDGQLSHGYCPRCFEEVRL